MSQEQGDKEQVSESQRKALARLGIAIGVAYSTRTVLRIDRARAQGAVLTPSCGDGPPPPSCL